VASIKTIALEER